MRSILIAGVLLFTLLTFYSALWFKSENIEDDITTRVTEDLETAQAKDVAIDVDGRHVTLSGIVYDEATETAYLDTADETYGALGPIDGLTMQSGGGFLKAVKSDAGITLTGAVPSDETRTALLEAAATGTSGEVVDQMTVGAAAGAWTDEAGLGLAQMANLSSGALSVAPDSYTLSGTTDGDADAVSEPLADRAGWQSFVSAPGVQSGLAAKLSDVTSERDGLQAQLATVTEERDEALNQGDATMAEVMAERSTLAQQLATMTATREVLSDTVSGMGAERDALTANVETLTQERDTAVADLDALRGSLSETQANTANLTGELDTTKAALATVTGRVGILEGQLAKKDTVIEGLNGQITDLTASNTALNDQITDLTASNTSLSDELAAQKSSMTSDQQEGADLRAKIADRDTTISTLQTGIETRDATIGRLEGQLEGQSDTSDAADAQIATLTGRVETLEGQADDMTGEVTQLTAMVAERDATIKDLRAAAPAATSANVAAPTAQMAQQCSVRAGEVLQTAQINFSSGTANLRENSTQTLERLTGIALACADSGLIVEIGGHTDSQGSEENNQDLGERRATTVAQFMIDRGVPATSLKPVGFGETQPIGDNETREGRQQNRRISFEWQTR